MLYKIKNVDASYCDEEDAYEKYGRIVGEGNTAEEALLMFVRNLNDDKVNIENGYVKVFKNEKEKTSIF